MTSSFIPMDTPNQPPAGEAAAEPSQVCPPPAPSQVSPAAEPKRRDAGAATTANLRAGLASRLRSAYEQGADLDELAAASHQSIAEVEQLLTLAGVDPAAARTRPAADRTGRAGMVPPQRHGLTGELSTGADQGGPGEEPRGAAQPDDGWRPSSARPRPRIRRPSPPRRLAGRPGAVAPAGSAAGVPGYGAAAVSRPAAVEPDAGAAAPASAPADEAVEPDEAAEAAGAEAPLGILIGGPRPVPASAERLEGQRWRRVTAQLIRVGRGTTLAVLPAWRPSIAVSVPTELLLEATGLGYEELARAELTVLINTEALHDRELRPRDWQVAPDHGSGRRRRG